MFHLSISASPPSPPCLPHDSHRNATIVWRDLTHLTTAPPNIPKHIHFTKVFCDIVIHPFIHLTVQADRAGATPLETTTCRGHVTRQLGRQVALSLNCGLHWQAGIGRRKRRARLWAAYLLTYTVPNGVHKTVEDDMLNGMCLFILCSTVSFHLSHTQMQAYHWYKSIFKSKIRQ